MIFQKLTSTYRVMASARIMLIVCVVATVLILNIETCSAVKVRDFCSKDVYHTCDSGICVLNQWVCDGDDDCGDNSDERGCEHPQCSPDEGEFLCSNNQCIAEGWRCDGDQDCDDGSDELHCDVVSCPPGQFSCELNSTKCIPEQWICDGHIDCPSQRDEQNCANKTCGSDEHQCRDGSCISMRWLCDGDFDCKDRSDELNCASATCPSDQWQCNNSQCIPSSWHCDGSFDCPDRSDEVNCPHDGTNMGRVRVAGNTCHTDGEFQCQSSGECIHSSWVCDLDVDCEDGSDEKDCGKPTCLPHYFECHEEHICIPDHLRCDGVNNCGDNSDELGCANNRDRCDERREFDCSSMSADNCISLAAVCDGRRQCHGGEDENATLCNGRYNHTADCEKNNGGCSKECVATYNGHYCDCPHGFELDFDGQTCKDINECELEGYCSQLCQNHEGGYKCKCQPGYQLDPEDMATCRAITGEPSLLFANRHDLRQLHIYSGRYRMVVGGMHSAIAIDYDIARKHVFFTDITSANISRVILNENSEPHGHEVLVSDDVHTPDGIAYDWIHQNLYWTDAGRDTVEVLGLYNGSTNIWRKTLISTELDEPRAIIVDPRHKRRMMYWTDWGRNPKIERSSMDGTGRRAIVTENILWPNGMTIDFESDRLFWVDAKLHVIFSSDLEGRSRQVLLTSYVYLHHPFSIAVFEDDIFWTDWQKQAIYKVSRVHSHNVTQLTDHHVSPVASSLLAPMDIRIHHPFKQPQEPNICAKNRCSHLCLPTASFPGFTCHCPNNQPGVVYTMHSDQRTCNVQTSLASSEIKPVEPSRQSAVDSDVRAQQQPASSKNTILIALSATSAVIFVVIFMMVVVLLRRAYRKRNIKTMNFDNPVYRKTTVDEEALSLERENQPTFQITATRQNQMPLLLSVSSSSSSPDGHIVS